MSISWALFQPWSCVYPWDFQMGGLRWPNLENLDPAPLRSRTMFIAGPVLLKLHWCWGKRGFSYQSSGCGARGASSHLRNASGCDCDSFLVFGWKLEEVFYHYQEISKVQEDPQSGQWAPHILQKAGTNTGKYEKAPLPQRNCGSAGTTLSPPMQTIWGHKLSLRVWEPLAYPIDSCTHHFSSQYKLSIPYPDFFTWEGCLDLRFVWILE